MPFPKPSKPRSPKLRDYPGGRQVCNLKTYYGRLEYLNRRNAMAIRQGGRCALCGLPMTATDPPTFDHQHGRGMGGSRRDDRIEINGQRFNAAVHMSCNIEKGSRVVEYKFQ
jgi:hypothetical protein